MAAKAYRVEGNFRFKNKKQHTFVKETVAKSEEEARDFILSSVGSNHRIQRRMICIESITELAPKDIQNPVVKYKMEA